jgi:hypothetical protein
VIKTSLKEVTSASDLEVSQSPSSVGVLRDDKGVIDQDVPEDGDGRQRCLSPSPRGRLSATAYSPTQTHEKRSAGGGQGRTRLKYQVPCTKLAGQKFYYLK